MLILLIYLIGVVIHILITNPNALDRKMEVFKKKHPNIHIKDDWKPSNTEIFTSCLLWPIILLSIIFRKLINKI